MLFDKTKFSWNKAQEWTRRDEEFVKRAAYALMAALACTTRLAGARDCAYRSAAVANSPPSRSASWIAADALRELQSEAVQ